MVIKRLAASLGLKWRLILGVSLLLLASSVLLSIFMAGQFSDAAIEGLQRRGTSLARNLAYNAEFGVMLENATELDGLVTGLLNDSDVLFAEIFTKDGALLTRSVRSDVDTIDICVKGDGIDFHKPINMKGQEVLSWKCQLPDGKDYVEFLSPVYTQKADVSKEELGSTVSRRGQMNKNAVVIGYVHMGLGLQETLAKIQETRQMIVFFTLLLVMLGILLSVTLVKMIASPINTLVEATERIAAGDLSQRVHVATDQELERLALAFNTMCDSVQKTQEELEQHNQNLEQMVRERTQRLEEAQQQVLQSEKMAAVGQLAAGVAHELNNPLGGILGYAQFALEKVQKGSLCETEIGAFSRYLSDIELQARRCKMIVKNLLKFSRSSNKEEFGLVDINASLEEVFLFTSHQLGMKDIHLNKQLQPNLPHIVGNANSLQQVFTNIIINSMQSMSEGGELIVRTSIEKPVGEFGGAVAIMFKDSGSGIPKENLSKIFEPFFTTKKVGEGTGLGLAVSYGIIRDHGGDIKAESTVDVGSTFTVVLPIVKEKVEITA
jgi:two-component system, NtrC family, sensor kinase